MNNKKSILHRTIFNKSLTFEVVFNGVNISGKEIDVLWLSVTIS